MVPTKCPNMFSGRVEACPCPEFKNKFPNLYLEPMQYNNPDGKWKEEIPYMIINLENDNNIYLGKNNKYASKYGWAGVLTQSHTSTVDGKEITMDHPVSYVSGLFHGSQSNWAALTKEVYAIYMSIKKSTFYPTGHEITLRSDHLPLKKFLRKMTLNNTVNNCSTEIESFDVNFVHISG